MTGHLMLRVGDNFASVTRVVGRLHALNVEIDELHLRGTDVCLHLGNPKQERRVRTVVDRLADAEVIDTAACVAIPGSLPRLPTRYVVARRPVDRKTPLRMS